MTFEQKEIYKSDDEILWNEWDPIGVNDVAPRVEYQSYVPEIFSMLIQNRSDKEISDRLYAIETETIGVIGSREHCLIIVKKLIEEKNKNAPQQRI
ncbi:hypothetical protein [Roseivirga seohaensis]|uniref:hypothetical protein n=1 Tax=Roseivirga seohaensis TaxID=1914963 RepID=UPI003BAB0040